jgi:3-phenylpropionate/trans-cinnamate dioxygenase ferredoxin subunit
MPAKIQKYPICRVAELPPGGRKIVNVDNKSIGVFNVKGKFFALRNICPHQFAPLCEGKITGTTLPSKPGEYLYAREGEIIRCPWHGWEFDITTGKSIFNPHKVKVRSYEVSVEKGCAMQDEDPSVETFEVSVEEDTVMLHL